VRQRFVVLIVAALCASAFRAAGAQTPGPTPTPIVLPTLPPNQPLNPYVKMGIDLITNAIHQQSANSKNSASGPVTYFRRFEMQVQTGPNAYRDVRLHQGTVINPRGASIVPGRRVNVQGLGQSDGSLAADNITVLQ